MIALPWMSPCYAPPDAKSRIVSSIFTCNSQAFSSWLQAKFKDNLLTLSITVIDRFASRSLYEINSLFSLYARLSTEWKDDYIVERVSELDDSKHW